MKGRNAILIAAAIFALTQLAMADEPARLEEASNNESLRDNWSKILEAQEQMRMVIAVKNLAVVENYAFKIRDLTAKLPGLSTNLAPERMTQLKEAVAEVGKLAAALDDTGDSGNQAGTEENAKKLRGVLNQIKSLYPADALLGKPSPVRPSKSGNPSSIAGQE